MIIIILGEMMIIIIRGGGGQISPTCHGYGLGLGVRIGIKG